MAVNKTGSTPQNITGGNDKSQEVKDAVKENFGRHPISFSSGEATVLAEESKGDFETIGHSFIMANDEGKENIWGSSAQPIP